MTNAHKFALCREIASRVVVAYRAEAPAGCDPQNSWVAIAVGVGGAAISAGGSLLAGSQKKKALSGAANADWGQKPKAAEYKPVDFNQQQLSSALWNLKTLGKGGGDLMNRTNEYIDSDAMGRAQHFIPGYRSMLKTMGSNTNSLINGQLPYDDVLDIAANRNELSSSLGVPGTGTPATLRDLGLSRMDAMKTGAGLMQNMVSMADSIDPTSRRMRPQDTFTGPMDRINFQMQQNQLIQQSDQNRNNIEAGISPSQQARNQIQLQQAGIAGQDTQAISSSIGSILGSIGGGFAQQGGGSGGLSSSGFYNSPSAAYSAYSSSGYSPVIMRNPGGAGYYSPYSVPI